MFENLYNNRTIFFGPIAGIVESVFMFPLDTLKVLKQSRQYHNFKTIYDNPFKLYKGFTPFTSQMFIKYGLRYNSFQFLKSHNDNTIQNFIAGSTSGFIESIFITPFELLKTQLQTSNNKFTHTIKKIISNRGIFSLYRGFTSTCLRQSINQGCNLSLYYNIKKQYINEDEKPNIFKICSIVLFTSSLGPIITAPIDTVKTRFMNPKFSYKTLKDAIYDIYEKESIKGFYNGIGLRLVRVTGGQMITFTVIENLMYYT
jgi:hypothetical protein